LWDWSDKNHTPEVQYGKAKGYGYDKVSAIAGMKFAGQELSDHPCNYEQCLQNIGFEVFTLL
ncbi:MAG: hypothetical protein AB4038_11570, partial [Prochloraceae cyanobacterium]